MSSLVLLLCCLVSTLSALGVGVTTRTPAPRTPALCGDPVSPVVDVREKTFVRYIYEGGTLTRGRLCLLPTASSITALDVLRALVDDGVDLKRFYACVYETEASGGGWLPVLRTLTELPAHEVDAAADNFEIPAIAGSRIDVQLCRRQGDSADALAADAAAGPPSGHLPKDGFHAIGVVNTKNQANVGTLWRSAYQLGAAFLFTVGTRYRQQPTDTLRTDSRLPLFELDDWSAFVNFAPARAKWVAIEMGGTPLAEFEHPHNAVYILGSEDAGLPPSILSACHEVVSIPSERYSSFNVASAGSIVLYDRLAKKERRKERE